MQSQEQLAWETDTSRSYLSEAEAGKHSLTVPMLLRLGEKLDVEPAEIIRALSEELRKGK